MHVSPIALKPAEIVALPPKEKAYKVSFGGAPYLLVSPEGHKYWRYKYRFGGREKNYSIGVFPDVSLRQAMQTRDDAKELLRTGVDPVIR